MTFDANEISLEGGRPIELFELTLGSDIFRWTSAEDDVSFGGIDYTAIEITRGDFAQGPDDRDNIMEIFVPASNVFAQKFTNVVPDQRATVDIRRVHRGDAEVITLWRGFVISVTFTEQNHNATITCRPEVGTSSRPIPRFTFQGLCNNVLYDGQCQVVRASFRHTNSVTSVSADQRTLTITGLSGQGADWAVGGYVLFGFDRRLILSQSGDNVTILLPFANSPLNQTADVQAGCDHKPETCKTKFSNLVNFQGFPYVPEINIFERGIDGTS